MPWTVIKQYIKCKAIKLNTYVWWELGVLWGNRQNGVNQQRILRKKKKKPKINYNKKESFLRFIFSPQNGNCPPKGFFIPGGGFPRRREFFLWCMLCWERLSTVHQYLFCCWIKWPKCLHFFIFEFANDWKLGNQGQTGLGRL